MARREGAAKGPVTGYHAIWIHIRDLNRARKFYRTALGLKESHYDKEGAWAAFEVPGGPPIRIHRQGRSEPGRKAGTVSGVFLRVRDVQKAAAWIAKHGGKVTDAPDKLASGRWIATVADPDGNEFVIVSPKRGR